MKGTINVQAENIFPIIKKFLYSDHEIFLRELVSNAVDATSKLKALSRMGEGPTDLGDVTIEIKLDEKKKTLHIIDKGIGMTQEEVEKYLNQVAFSGASEFLEKYEGKVDDAGIIGHFGLGFYSAFMVSKKVEVITKSWKDESAVKWVCDGSPEFTVTKSKKTERGTEIILHIDEESIEFTEKARISSILEKYCKFLPVAIKFGTKDEYEDDPSGEKDDKGNVKQLKKEVDNIINNPNPLWKKQPTELSAEDYSAFYKELYPMTFEEPLFNIHINVDYPFNLTGVLYFPKLAKHKVELSKNKIQLYSNQVFITDSVENVVPEFLTLLHGVIDSPDIPLNVSRSYLQSDSNVKKISSHISKKVADKLAEMFKNDREDFEKKWPDMQVFMDYGLLTDEKFYERIQPTYLLKNTSDAFKTFDEYKEQIKEKQTDKDGNLVMLYTNDAEAQHSLIAKANKKGYDVLEMNTPLTSHLVQQFEMKMEKVQFKRVDADALEKLISKADAVESNLSEDQKNALTPVIQNIIEKDKFSIQFESLDETDPPMMITQSEFMRRMKEQAEVGGGMMGMGNMPDSFNLVVNSNHPLISKILLEENADKKQQMAKQAADLAMLSKGLLKGEKLTAFIERSVSLID
ncbi:molecular chaperone HtpG [Salibacteraceae bacterium]|nr:molecular chaperone HtpG [Salibacteraceae bacterium]MDB4104186.1 molecular chaperone HtpG [Salibacteraceae bacterium]MDC1220119.1 molecular chaperone HtpG [bacterium]